MEVAIQCRVIYSAVSFHTAGNSTSSLRPLPRQRQNPAHK